MQGFRAGPSVGLRAGLERAGQSLPLGSGLGASRGRRAGRNAPGLLVGSDRRTDHRPLGWWGVDRPGGESYIHLPGSYGAVDDPRAYPRASRAYWGDAAPHGRRRWSGPRLLAGRAGRGDGCPPPDAQPAGDRQYNLVGGRCGDQIGAGLASGGGPRGHPAPGVCAATAQRCLPRRGLLQALDQWRCDVVRTPGAV